MHYYETIANDMDEIKITRVGDWVDMDAKNWHADNVEWIKVLADKMMLGDFNNEHVNELKEGLHENGFKIDLPTLTEIACMLTTAKNRGWFE